MIKLTRLDRQEIAINCDRIAWVEGRPDTTLRMTTGESILVRESVDEVVRRIAAFRSGVLRDAGLAALFTSGTFSTPLDGDESALDSLLDPDERAYASEGLP
jgi:flagellar protein FlbD